MNHKRVVGCFGPTSGGSSCMHLLDALPFSHEIINNMQEGEEKKKVHRFQMRKKNWLHRDHNRPDNGPIERKN